MNSIIQKIESIAGAERRAEILSFIRELTAMIHRGPMGYTGPKGDKGEKGDAGSAGKDGKDGIGKNGRDGKDGRDGVDGADAEIDTMELRELAAKPIKEHEKKFDHALIHDPKVLGKYMLDEDTIQEGDLLQVRGSKLVGVKLPEKELRTQFATSSQGVSNLRSISVTQSRELDAMGLYIIDATAGNITITVPTAAGRENYMYELIRIDLSANTVTVIPTGSETMSGMTDYVMRQWTDVQLFAYSLNWLLRNAS